MDLTQAAIDTVKAFELPLDRMELELYVQKIGEKSLIESRLIPTYLYQSTPARFALSSRTDLLAA